MQAVLIRREVTADRGQTRKHRHAVTVSTEAVIEAVGVLGEHWTTTDIAAQLGVRERAVRSAVGWLLGAKLIKRVEEKSWSINPDGSIRWVGAQYAINHPAGDVSMLNQIIRAWA